MFGLRSRQTRRIWSERKEKTSRRAQGRFSRRCSRGYARHSSGIHERQSAPARYSTTFGAGAEQGSGSRRTGKKCCDGTGNKAQAETRGETETCLATARAGCRAAFTLAATANTAKHPVALAPASSTGKCPVALAGTGANKHCVTLALIAAARHVLALTSVPLHDRLDPKVCDTAKT